MVRRNEMIEIILFFCLLLSSCFSNPNKQTSEKDSQENISFPKDGATSDAITDCIEGKERPCSTSQACYPIAGKFECLGLCKEGVQRCVHGNWGHCEGEVLPTPEVCLDQKDNNCNGEIDEQCRSCSPTDLEMHFEWKGHKESPQFLVVSKDEKYAISYSDKEKISLVWDLQTQNLLHELSGLAIFSYDGKEIFLMGSTIQQLDTQTGVRKKEILPVHPSHYIHWIPLQNRKTALVQYGNSKYVSLLNLETWSVQTTWSEHTANVVNIDINEKKQLMLTASSQEVLLYEQGKPQSKHKWQFSKILGAVFNADATQVLISTTFKIIRIDIASNKAEELSPETFTKAVFPNKAETFWVGHAIYADNNNLLIPSHVGFVLWDWSKSISLQTFFEPVTMASDSDRSLYLPLSKRIWAGFRSTNLYLWDLQKKSLGFFPGASNIGAVHVEKDWLASFSASSQQIHLYSLQQKKYVSSLEWNEQTTSETSKSFVFSPQGNYLLGTVSKNSKEKILHVWDLQKKAWVAKLTVSGQAFWVQNETKVLSISSDQVVLFDLSTQKKETIFSESALHNLWISKDEKRWIFQLSDKLVIWDSSQKKELYRLSGKEIFNQEDFSLSSLQLFFSLDSKSWMTWRPNQSVKQWSLQEKKLLFESPQKKDFVIQERETGWLWMFSVSSKTSNTLLASFFPSTSQEQNVSNNFFLAPWKEALLGIFTLNRPDRLYIQTSQKLYHWDLLTNNLLKEWIFPENSTRSFSGSKQLFFDSSSQLFRLLCKEP